MLWIVNINADPIRWVKVEYYGNSNRVKTDGKYLYDQLNRLTGVYKVADSKTDSYFYMGNMMLGKTVEKASGSDDFYFITDHLGSTMEVLDSQGRSVYQNDMSAFGVPLGESGLEDEQHELFYRTGDDHG